MKRILILLLLPTLAWAQQGPPPAPVRVANATLEQMAPMTLVAGTVVSRSDARLAAEVEGRLLEVADVGTRVEEGDVLAVIEDTTLTLRKSELEAEKARARARLVYLDAEEKRLETLVANNLTSTTQFEQTRSDRQVAQSDLRIAETRLAQVNDQIQRTRIKAPFNGTVVERLSQAGERLGIGTDVVRLVNANDLEVVARAPLDYMPYVVQGDIIDVSTGRRFEQGTVRTVVAVGSANTHVFELRLDIPAQLFPVGQTVRVSIPMSDRREVLAIPRDGLVLRSDGTAVFVIGDDNTARRIPVETGVGNGDLIEVNGELVQGDKVVVRGNERLQPGQTVSIMEG